MRSEFYRWRNERNATTPIEIARFGLLCTATLPLSLWVAFFSYDYIYRLDLCQEALTHQDHEIMSLNNKDSENRCFGREKEMIEVNAFLNKNPHQVLVIAGANESGKSRFVSEMLRELNTSRGITYIQLAQLGVDSVSTLTHAIVDAFNLKWLSMRYALVDVLPFAGSEIVVMKERFSERDLNQGLRVITQALQENAASSKSRDRLPIIVIDGIGEGASGWINSPEGERCLHKMLSWCIYLTKERQLAHIIYTGNEKFVLNIMDGNRLTRGHIKILGLGDLSREESSRLALQDFPNASEDEIRKILNTFGGFIHDVRGVSRDIHNMLLQQKEAKERSEIVDQVISSKFREQVERVRAAFAKGKDEDESLDDSDAKEEEEEEEMDPFMDPLKAVYSEAQASKRDASLFHNSRSESSYSKLQLWQTIQRLVNSERMTVPFAELRDDVFDGDISPLLELMHDDVFGFEINNSSSTGGLSWKVKPATPALGRAFRFLTSNGGLKKQFDRLEIDLQYREEIKDVERQRRLLWQKRKNLELRKSSLKGTVDLGIGLGQTKIAKNSLASVYESIVAEEAAYESQEQDLRYRLDTLLKNRADLADSASQDISGTQDDAGTKQLPRQQSQHIERKLKSAILQIIAREEPGIGNLKETFERKTLEKAFRYLDRSGDGVVAAEDLVRVIENITGEKVKIEAAQSLIRAWDMNNDKKMDFDEFINIILNDQEDK